MAGILPGLLLTLLFMAAVTLMTLVDPKAGPRGEWVPMSKRMMALLRAFPLLIVIVVSIGGIYLGVFTPVEAAGVGAGLVILMALAMRKLEWRAFKQAVSANPVGTTAMLYLIIIGASVLNPFLALTYVPANAGRGDDIGGSRSLRRSDVDHPRLPGARHVHGRAGDAGGDDADLLSDHHRHGLRSDLVRGDRGHRDRDGHDHPRRSASMSSW